MQNITYFVDSSFTKFNKYLIGDILSVEPGKIGLLAVILVLSGVIAILEYRRISDYVSDLISSNIKSIALSQQLSDITEEYNHQMLAVVIQNDLSLMPDFNKDYLLRMLNRSILYNALNIIYVLTISYPINQISD